MSIERFQVGPRMSAAVSAGGLLFLAGQVADDTSADVPGQTQQILAKIDAILAEAGIDKTRIVNTTIWLADISNFGKMNEVWDAWVPAGHTPARATVEAKLATPAHLVEIGVIALR